MLRGRVCVGRVMTKAQFAESKVRSIDEQPDLGLWTRGVAHFGFAMA
jgi:hypothetical protein